MFKLGFSVFNCFLLNNLCLLNTEGEGSVEVTEALLKSIDSQLKTLNENMSVLCKKADASNSLYFQDVVAKFEATQKKKKKLFNNSLTVNGNSESNTAVNKKIEEICNMFKAIAEKQDRNDRQLTQTLRENANFQIQVRQGMQRDIETLKEQQSGEFFNPILKEIATIYVDYFSLLDDENVTEITKKKLQSLFETLEDLLTEYDVTMQRSQVGELRKAKATKIIEKITTKKQDLHNTIAKSRKPGFVRGKLVLSPEFVDVYIYEQVQVPDVSMAVDEKTTNANTDEKSDIVNFEKSTSEQCN